MVVFLGFNISLRLNSSKILVFLPSQAIENIGFIYACVGAWATGVPLHMLCNTPINFIFSWFSVWESLQPSLQPYR